MSDIFSDSMSMDDLSINNIHNLASQIIINRTKKKVMCFYYDLKNKEEKSLVEIDLKKEVTIIRPINTIEDSSLYLQSKYSIKEFVFEGFEIEIDSTDSYGEAIYGLPNGFTKTLKFGLGLERKYKIIITTLQKYCNDCEQLIISKTRPTDIEKNKIIISEDDFDKIRRGIDRNQDLFQKEAVLAKEVFVYDSILNHVNPEKYPNLKSAPRKDIIYKVLRNTEFRKLSKNDKQTLSKLKDNTDLSYLTILVAEFEEKLDQSHKESTYQLFFEENPLLLTVIAGSPYIQFKNQAYVGGKSFDNLNGQYPDFLHKHKITNNTFIIEIKTPQTSLLEKLPYRETGVYSASKELSGSISQILTQKYQLETEIASLLKNAEDRNVEAYNVQGLLIIGSLSSLVEKEKKRSFELYRHNQKNLRIVTYDECFEQLKTFIDLLSKSDNISQSDDSIEE